MLLMQAQKNGVVLDEEQLLFIVGGQTNTFDENVDEAPVQDLAFNKDNTMFMVNISSTDPIYDEAGPSYDSDILSESAQCVSANEQNKVVNESLIAKLARYKEQVELYEKKSKVVQIILWYLDSGYSKHITGNRLRLMNFMKKFNETVRFGNDHFGAIMGYGDYVICDSVISKNGIVKRWNHTLKKAAGIMLIFSKALMFLWAEVVATACVAARPAIKDNTVAQTEDNPFVNVFALEPSSEESSSGDVSLAESNQVIQPHNHLRKWSKDHRMNNVIGNPSRLVSTRKQLATMPCGAFIILYFQKSNPRMSRLPWMKLAGLKLCKKKFTNLIVFKYQDKPTKKHLEAIKRVFWYLRKTINIDKMADENVPAPAPAPTRSDEQILPFNAWLPVGKGNLLLDLKNAKESYLSHLRLEIILVDSTHPFMSPPAGDQIMDL
uniref:Integrase, catalytic region, zinc finger, CCHC-type, peptidase aspartic, catalytic n=1 Tax=Tanacetum cinerariifolium TaxID=118510 RepID=A0A6L2KIX3_TANCI|nr:integrase, catalytic region, zinc finger, CCHC-type, peptidase aspartic, catalytic [Tanacetum cinerariifolium]